MNEEKQASFSQLAAHRQSCRNFDASRTVAREDIDACLMAARLAPSACNSQPWHFTVCTGQKAAEAALCTQSLGMNKFASAAPCFVVFSEEAYNASAAVGSRLKKQDYRCLDIGLAAAHLVLEAEARGLATCLIGWFDEKKLAELTRVESRIRLVAALGYAAPGDVLREKKRKDADELITYL